VLDEFENLCGRYLSLNCAEGSRIPAAPQAGLPAAERERITLSPGSAVRPHQQLELLLLQLRAGFVRDTPGRRTCHPSFVVVSGIGPAYLKLGLGPKAACRYNQSILGHLSLNVAKCHPCGPHGRHVELYKQEGSK
jgi:hypothetical protein